MLEASWDDDDRPSWSKIGRDPQLQLPADPNDTFDQDDVAKFFEEYAELGGGPIDIGLSLGWSPREIQQFCKTPEFAEIMMALDERLNESVERAMHRLARGGNVRAAQLWLYNKGAHRGWADRRSVKVEAQSQQEIIVSVRAALNEHTRELVEANGEAGIAALQAALLDDDDIVDAVLVEDDAR